MNVLGNSYDGHSTFMIVPASRNTRAGTRLRRRVKTLGKQYMEEMATRKKQSQSGCSEKAPGF